VKIVLSFLIISAVFSINCDRSGKQVSKLKLENRDAVVEKKESVPQPEKKKSMKISVESWNELEKGLHLGKFKTKRSSIMGDSIITILRIDPNIHELKLLTASEHHRVMRSAKAWAEDYNLSAVINAGMFHHGGQNVGFMKNYDHVNNPGFAKSYKAIFAFNAKDQSVAKAKILDLECDDFQKMKDKYSSFTQSIRMFSCKGKNVWSKDQKMWSVAALGIDGKGNVLFIHSRSPYRMHDFINELNGMGKVNLSRLLYLEGGPEATLHIRNENYNVSMVGSYETGFNENDDNNREWLLPNVIGVVRKADQK